MSKFVDRARIPTLMLAPDPWDWIAEDDPAPFVIEAVERAARRDIGPRDEVVEDAIGLVRREVAADARRVGRAAFRDTRKPGWTGR